LLLSICALAHSRVQRLVWNPHSGISSSLWIIAASSVVVSDLNCDAVFCAREGKNFFCIVWQELSDSLLVELCAIDRDADGDGNARDEGRSFRGEAAGAFMCSCSCPLLDCCRGVCHHHHCHDSRCYTCWPWRRGCTWY
jgi:hypothetical protein